MTKLMIVESPKKAKKIQTYMGSDWVVKASFGHIRDLPEKEMGVDLANFTPQYVVTAKSKSNLAALKSLSHSADQVYLATDPDREGEAIAWHLQQTLFLQNPKRITFQEISKKALDAALAKPRQIDQQLVRAQEGRRVLDRLVGYTVSPALCQVMSMKLSAGRVQSVALRLVVEREQEIKHFKPTAYIEVFLVFETSGVQWRAQWMPGDRLAAGQKYWTDRALAERVANITDVDVISVDSKKRNRRPPAPFITSTLQQAASVALKMSPKKCMEIAQDLFEEGWISYHRTDNPNLSAESAQEVMDWLRQNNYAEHVADKPNSWKAKSGAQEGHEAIRVSDINQMPDIAKSRMTDEQYRLYSLIWLRTVACQMKDAQYNSTQVVLRSTDQLDGQYLMFAAKGDVLLYPGWLKLSGKDHADESADDSENQSLPALINGQHLVSQDGEVVDKKTKPSPRYTEASLIKKLEDEGIGRPSTYASIMHNIIEVREYVKIGKRMLHATDIGMRVCNLMVGKFQFMELGYTREIESQLDEVACGRIDYAKVVSSAYFILKKEMSALDGIAIQPATHAPQHVCPTCQKALRLIKGEFWGCTGYPDCKYTAPNVRGKPGQRKTESAPDTHSTQYPCECGKGYLRMRHGKDAFWGCSTYPACKVTRPDDAGKPGQRNGQMGNTASQQKTTAQYKPDAQSSDGCPGCGTGQLVSRTVKAGKNKGKPFIGCSNYPACDHFAWSK